jgi:hypothetical protein
MFVAIDLVTGLASLGDPSNFTAFQANVTGGPSDQAASDAAAGAVLADFGAGGPADVEAHVWVAKSWIEAIAPTLPDAGDDWAAGFEKMVAFAAKMGWLDESGEHIKAHIER